MGRDCETCDGMPIPGVLHRPGDGGRYGHYIERCDGCLRFPSDCAAGEAAAARFGGELWQDQWGYFLAPAGCFRAGTRIERIGDDILPPSLLASLGLADAEAEGGDS